MAVVVSNRAPNVRNEIIDENANEDYGRGNDGRVYFQFASILILRGKNNVSDRFEIVT